MTPRTLTAPAPAPASPPAPRFAPRSDVVPDAPDGTGESVGWYSTWGKPALDYLLALVLLPPALLLVGLAALAVKLTSPGPVFYTQTRVGRGGRLYRLVKIRTMRHRCEAASGPCWSRPGDARVTAVGRFLRATHLDELPQLLNVLRGDMSLVGPRPERPEIIAALDLERAVEGYRGRLAVRPGVTGLAQLLLPPDTDVGCVRRKVVCDLDYIRRSGPWLDLRILGGTLLKVFGTSPQVIARALGRPRPGAEARSEPAPAAPGPTDDGWRAALSGLLEPPVPAAPGDPRAEVRAWFRAVAAPAVREFADELRLHGRRVRVTDAAEQAGLRVWAPGGRRELDLKFRVCRTAAGPRVYARELVRDGRRDFVHEHPLDRPIGELTAADVLAFLVARYRAGAARAA